MLMLICAAILLAVNFTLVKFYQKGSANTNYDIMVFNAIVGTFSGLIFFVANGFKLEFNVFSVGMSLLFTLFVFVYHIIGFKIMAKGMVAVYTMFLMAGGMTIPYLYGVFFLQEEISLLRVIGLVVIVSSLIISNADSIKLNFKLFLMCVAVFALNGCVSIVSKTHQISEYAVSTNSFIVMCNIFSALAGYLMTFVYKNNNVKKKQKKTFGLKNIVLLFFVAATSGTSSFLQLKGAQNIPASVLYPVITGGTVVFTALAAGIVFKEKGSAKFYIGIAMCFLGTCMFL